MTRLALGAFYLSMRHPKSLAFLALAAFLSVSAFAAQTQHYRVLKGDTLNSVAGKYGVSVAKLAAANRLRASASLRSGQLLRIPATPTATAATHTQPSKPAQAPKPVQRVRATPPGRYIVQEGDTLASIAEKFRISMDSLSEWNGLTSSNLLSGQELIVSPPTKTLVSAPTRTTRPVITRVSTFADSTQGDDATYD